MPQRVFLHIGVPKTGTTFLQGVLWSQRDRAASQGLHLPLRSMHDHFLGSLDVRGLGGKPPHPADSAGAWDRLVEATRAHDGTVLISHELLSAASADQARKAVGWFGSDLEVHLVVTARDLLRQVTAEWQEHVKHRNTVSLEEFVRRVRDGAPERKGWFWLVQDYPGILQRWGSRLPASRLHVVTVPPKGAASDELWNRFAGVLGLDAGSFDLDASRANTSLGREQTEVLRQVNAALGDRLPFPGPYPAVAKDVLAHGALAGRAGQRLTLTDDDVAFARAEGARMVEQLDALGADVVGSLDDLLPSDEAAAAATSPEAYAVPGTDAMLTESVSAIADLLVALSEEKAEVGRLRGELDGLRGRGTREALRDAAGAARRRIGYPKR
ncbi:MAG: hypothetical protein CMH83_16885 [Nocardioides sp.]|nr:hypothetical protein [Nocardioides sp.]